MLVVTFIFWLSAFGLIYIYFGYPFLIQLLAFICPKRIVKAPYNGLVSVVIAAHNEESVLSKKLASLLAPACGKYIREILIGSDGSTDRTLDVCREVADSRILLHNFPQRRGKATVLNELIPLCRSPVVILTDARQTVASDALDKLLSCFSDPHVGVVSGELILHASRTPSALSKGLGAYWRYEKWIRKNESLYASVPGATGALYAIKKELFKPIEENTLLDDVAIPMTAILQGARCIYESAFVYDDLSLTAKREKVRKRRTIAGVMQLIWRNPSWLWPTRNPIWIQYVSHKVLRLVSPLLLVALLISSLLLFRFPIYRFAFIGQMMFYGSAVLGSTLNRVGLTNRWTSMCLAFVELNLSILSAAAQVMRGSPRVPWE